MTEYLPFVKAGLVSGRIVGLPGTSLVLTRKASGTFTFGQGAMARVGACAFCTPVAVRPCNYGRPQVLKFA